MSAASETPAKRPRDPRLDFFRGLGMVIILIAHIPWNPGTNWIPARFGFSDAADMFVFCSGMASAMAFGRVFSEAGWWMGSARIAQRVWQVYWAHIGSVLIVVAVLLSADHLLGGEHYIRDELNLTGFFESIKTRFVQLLTLHYVPNYFDILPMYMAILCMVPIVMGLAQIHKGLVAAFVIGLWLAASMFKLNLTADTATARQWFFNPFSWQLLFFTGFAFMRGWLPAPPRDPRLIAAAIALVLVAAPISCQSGFACYAGWGQVPVFGDVHDALQVFWIDKMYYGPLRYAHFLATAYLAYILVGERGANLRGKLVDLTRRVGQQTLAVFLTGLVTAQLVGIFLDLAGRNFIAAWIGNLSGIAILIAAAIVVGWFKSAPWSKPRKARIEAQTPDHQSVTMPRAELTKS